MSVIPIESKESAVGERSDEAKETTKPSLGDVLDKVADVLSPGEGKLSKDEILRMIDDLVAEEETVTVDAGGAEQTKLNEIFKAIDKEIGETHDAVTLKWSDVKFSVGQKQILRGCSGTISPGGLCAIMGPSGAGKSTMMNFLAGRLPDKKNISKEGTVYANGAKVDPRQFRGNIAYVMQEDALFATQTPREAFKFSARLRLPNSVSQERIDELVECMIDVLSLRKCADTLIGSKMIPGISGGEKKRTSIGIELISNPSVLFLDEPTSGLDSYAAFQVVKILKKLSRSGRTIIVTIHQPSSEIYNLFDDLLLLASGRVVYHDRISRLPSYLAEAHHKIPRNTNPGDHVIFLMQTLSPKELEDMCDRWQAEPTRESSSPPKTLEDAEEGGKQNSTGVSTSNVSLAKVKSKANCCVQFRELAMRELRNVIRDKGSLAARFGTTLFLNAIVGAVFFGAANWSSVADGNVADIFSKSRDHFGALVQIFISAMMGMSQPTILTFPLERPVFVREYALGTYQALPYLLSKVMVEIPVALVQSSLIFLVVYWLLGLSTNFAIAVMIGALLGLVGSSLALMIGACAGSVQQAMQFTPLLFVPQFLFAGLFVPIDSIPISIRWVQYLCFLKYALNIILVTEFGNPETFPVGWNSSLPDKLYHDSIFGCNGDDLRSDGSCVSEGPAYDAALLPSMEVQPSNFWFYMAVMLSVFVVFRTAALGALVSKAKSI